MTSPPPSEATGAFSLLEDDAAVMDLLGIRMVNLEVSCGEDISAVMK
jgi:hypothetical protein